MGRWDAMRFAVGLDDGMAADWSLKLDRDHDGNRRLVAGQRWRAHARTPTYSGFYGAGVASIALEGQTLVTGSADGSGCLWERVGGVDFGKETERATSFREEVASSIGSSLQDNFYKALSFSSSPSVLKNTEHFSNDPGCMNEIRRL